MTILKVDWDTKTLNMDAINHTILSLCRIYKAPKADVQIMETNKGFHGYISIHTELDDKDQIFCQLALGSDVNRELFNLQRVMGQGHPYWNVLFVAKYSGSEKTSEEVESCKYTINLTEI